MFTDQMSCEFKPFLNDDSGDTLYANHELIKIYSSVVVKLQGCFKSLDLLVSLADITSG